MIRPFRRAAGYTLVELMFTIAILGIILAIALPTFSDYFEKNRLRGAADDTISFLAQARAEAVKRDRDVNVKTGGSGAAWCLGANSAADPTLGEQVPAAEDCDCTSAGACTIGGDAYTLDGAQYTDVTIDAANDEFVFDSKVGTIDNLTGAAFTLSSASDRWALRIDVSPLGQARACVPDGKDPLGGYKSC
jgi:type IV fimbrial biogenesis protein FimT